MRTDEFLQHRTVPLELPVSANQLHVVFDAESLYLGKRDQECVLRVSIPSLQQIENVTLTFDAYVLTNPVHPEGHLGWWTVKFRPGDELNVLLSTNQSHLTLNFSQPVTQNWIGASLQSNDPILLHLVLRHPLNNAIVSQQSLVVYLDRQDFEQSFKKRVEYSAPQHMYSAPSFGWPKDTRVHVVSASLPRYGQISSQPEAVLIDRQLRAIGVESQLYADQFDPELRGAVLNTKELLDRVSGTDLVMVLYSGHEPNMSWLVELNCIKSIFNLGVPFSLNAQAFDAEFHRNTEAAFQDYRYFSKFDVIGCASKMLKLAMRKSGIDRKIIVAEKLVELAPFWNSTPQGKPEQSAFPSLVYPGKLDPYNDFVKTLEVFEYVQREMPEAMLFASSSCAWRVYEQYIQHLLSTRFMRIKERVHLRTNSTDSERKALFSRCAALIDIGPSAERHVDTAVYFKKELFTSSDNVDSQRPGAYRLYGSQQEKARQLLCRLSDTSEKSVSNEKYSGHDFWSFIEASLRAGELKTNRLVQKQTND